MTTPGQVVRLKRAGHVFEVLTNPGAVTAWRAKPDSPADLNSMLISPVIFANQSKGLRASSAALITAFETDANDECIRLILKTGELQVSASERHDKVELCKKQIIAALHKGYIDPRTQLPHPLIRIESAASGVKGWKPDPEKPIPVQAQELVKKLQGTLSLVKSEISATLTIPGAYSGACSSIVHRICHVDSENYGADRAVTYAIMLSPGDLDAFIAALSKVTKGDFQLKMDKAGSAPAETAPVKGGGKKKGKK